LGNLTARQTLVLRIVVDATLAGLPPTLRQIGQVAGIRSTNGVNDHLNVLVRRGLLLRGKRSARDLRLTDAGRRVAAELTAAAAATATSKAAAVAPPKGGAR